MPRLLEPRMKRIFVDHHLAQVDPLKEKYANTWEKVESEAGGSGPEELNRRFLESLYELWVSPQSFDEQTLGSSREYDQMFGIGTGVFTSRGFDDAYPGRKPGGALLMPAEGESEELIREYLREKSEALGEEFSEKDIPEDLIEELLVNFHQAAKRYIARPGSWRVRASDSLDRRFGGKDRPFDISQQVVDRFNEDTKCDLFAAKFAALCREAGVPVKVKRSQGAHWETMVFTPRNGWVRVHWPEGFDFWQQGIRKEEGGVDDAEREKRVRDWVDSRLFWVSEISRKNHPDRKAYRKLASLFPHIFEDMVETHDDLLKAGPKPKRKTES